MKLIMLQRLLLVFFLSLTWEAAGMAFRDTIVGFSRK